MIGRPLKRTLLRDESGNHAIEFALLAPVFIGMACGLVDLTYWTYVKASATGAIEKVARSAGVGGATVNPNAFEVPVQNLILKISKNATFAWTKKSYKQFSGVGQPEKLTSDKNSNGGYDAGDCFEDSNPNGTYDALQGTTGVGGADDIVYYNVVVSFQPLIPLSRMFTFLPDSRRVSASTMIKRQPYAAQTTPSIVCV